MKKGLIYFTALALGIATFSSCKKTEGEGGGATIQGVVFKELYDHNGKLVDTEQAREENVYIIYGDNEFYDDDINTNPDGSYQFKYLKKGNYTIFAYEDCDSCDSQTRKVEVTVEITDKKAVVTAPDLDLYENHDIEDGTATVTGTIMWQDYSGTMPVGNPYTAQKERVYIVYDTDATYFEWMRTDGNGSYKFDNLIKGKYTIYAYSQCSGCTETTMGIIETTVEITSNGEVVKADDIEIENRNW